MTRQNLRTEPPMGARHKIIVGVDYGTTFSGVSYVTTDKNDIDDIELITNWPGEVSTAWKTPTRIAYSRENANIQVNKWGFEVDSKLKSYSWTKLLLDRNAEVGEYDDPALSRMSGQGMMTLPAHRNAAGVCEDFLREVYKHVNKVLEQRLGKVTCEMTPMECWITLPAIWSEEAKSATHEAAKKAGFNSCAGDEIFTISEPEAAAIATLSKYTGRNDVTGVKPLENILICDCGGGTVDITTYTITEVKPHLNFDELCIGTGGKCGATYIDRNLHTLLSRRFGKAFDSVSFEQKGPGSKFMASFEKLKRSFGHDQDFSAREVGPLKMDARDSMFYDEDERMVKLTYADMQSLFDPVIQEITKLISDQVNQVKKKGKKIDRIILVGGFGDSPYLFQRLESWCEKNGKIQLMCPEQAQAAVVRGAALRGLEGIAPCIKQARRHYGFAWSMPFREGVNDERNAYIVPFSEEKYCTGLMKWVINKGESVFKGTYRSIPVRQALVPGTQLIDRLQLYSSALNDPQERFDQTRVEPVGCIISSFPANLDWGDALETTYNARLRKNVSRVQMQIEVVFGDKGDNLLFRTVVNGKPQGITTIEFPKA